MTKILVVDDDTQGLYMLRTLLEGHGYEVETAVNGQIALEKARTAPPNIIVSDILMPVMDGFNLCRTWMQDKELQTTPFVIYTATYTDAKDEELALSLGAVRFIRKPSEPDELVTIIEGVLQETTDDHREIAEIANDEEPVFLKKYNERLIHKLEDKVVQVKHANQRLKALNWVSTNLAAIKPMRQIIAHALHIIIEAMEYSYANYFAFEEQSQLFRLIDAVAYTEEEFKELQRQLVFKLGEARGLVGLVGRDRQPLIVAETSADSRWIAADESLHSALFVPVMHEGELFGVLSFFSTEPNAFSEGHARDMMTLANNLAIAIENARLYEAEQKYAEQLEAEVAARTAELQVALEQSQAADKMKSRFVSNMNHELRTPLTVIKLYLGLLDHGRPDNWERYIATLTRETERLQLMVEEVLDISRLDLGRTTAHLEPVDLNFLIGDLIMDRAELATAKSLTLDFEPAANLPYVLADKQLLFQVLTNFLANAINYTNKGGITMCTATAVANDQLWVTASVADTGPGISDLDKIHLFDRFYRGDAGQNSSAPGTGLGLSISREIINLHNGQISLESTLNEGSTFTIWLHPVPTSVD